MLKTNNKYFACRAAATSYRSGTAQAETSLKRYKYVYKELDNETGFYNYGMRFYAPNIARFVSVDPLQFDYPDLTSFQYASNRPVSGIDLDGKEFQGFNLNDIKSPLQVEQDNWKEIEKEARPAMKAVYETTIVLDGSITLSSKYLPGVVFNPGVSLTLSLNPNKIAIYPHFGYGLSVQSSFGRPFTPTFSLGIVGGNFTEAADYYGGFYDYSADICGVGAAYCYWPGGANATSLSLNPSSLIETILTRKLTMSYTERYDFYFFIPLLETEKSKELNSNKQWNDALEFIQDKKTYLNMPSLLFSQPLKEKLFFEINEFWLYDN